LLPCSLAPLLLRSPAPLLPLTPDMDILAVVSRADELYRLRTTPGAVKDSVSLLAGVVEGADRFELQWRLARALFFLGQEASAASTKQQLHAAGIGAGERAVALNRDRVEGHFWFGVNLALFAESSGSIKAVLALLGARSHLKRAAGIDESYHDAGPLRVLARIAHKAPRLFGGSPKRSRQFFDRALRIAPLNSVTLIYAAEQALACSDRDRAVNLLEQIIKSDLDPDWEYENRRDREMAEAMLKSIDGRRS
jgi:hypothetical protein